MKAFATASPETLQDFPLSSGFFSGEAVFLSDVWTDKPTARNIMLTGFKILGFLGIASVASSIRALMERFWGTWEIQVPYVCKLSDLGRLGRSEV